jgi:trehalose 6-phosphate phosphatase
MSKVGSTTQSVPTPLSAPPLPGDAARWALLLDVDGTLLDFADDPLAVEVDAPLLDLLHRLHRALDGALALVSGRGLDDLDRLFGYPRWAAIGLHGLQLRHADGSFRRIEVAAAQQGRMRDAARSLADRFDGVRVEDKQSAIALHCPRGPEQLSELHEAARELLYDLPGYELQPGRRVLEFKPAGMDKGRAVLELLGRGTFVGRTPAYLGDDLTDEHAFAVINQQHGISVRVGSRDPTVAHFTLPDPAATSIWLNRLLEVINHGTQPHAAPTGGQQRQP